MSEAEGRSSGSVTPWLVGLVLLATLTALVIVFVPLVECPKWRFTNAHWEDSSDIGGIRLIGPLLVREKVICETCSGGGKATILKKWTDRRAMAGGRQ